MGRRRSSFGDGFTFPRPSLPRLPRLRRRPETAPSPPPQTVKCAPPPPVATAQPSDGFASSLAEGLGFGTGNGIAQRALDSVMGPRTIRHETVASEAASASSIENNLGSGSCGIQVKTFVNCLTEFSSDISKCQYYMDMITDCKKHSRSMTSA